MLIPPELFLLAALGAWHLIHSVALPWSFKTEWTVSERSKPLWLAVAAPGHDRQKRQRGSKNQLWQNAWSRSRLGGVSGCSWWTTAIATCLSVCWDTVLRSQPETLVRVHALCWALLCACREKGEGFQLPAHRGLAAGREAKGNPVSEVYDRDERGREQGRGRKKSEQASAGGTWEDLKWGSWLSG